MPKQASTWFLVAIACLILPGVAQSGRAVGQAIDEGLRKELLERMERDQEVRGMDFAQMDKAEQTRMFKEWMRVDAENTAWLKSVIEEHGWPTSKLVGKDGTHAAWLLVQHADQDPRFQAACLPLLEKAAAEGEGSLADVAYLTDRVRVKQGLPQLYGTQYDVKHDGASGETEYIPPLVEDVEHLDERRRAAGLGPWHEYDAAIAEIQKREPFAAPRAAPRATDAAPPAVETAPLPSAPWPMQVAREPMIQSGRDGYLLSVMNLFAREQEAGSSELLNVFLDVLATRLAYVGEHQRAMTFGDAAYGQIVEPPADFIAADWLAMHTTQPALETIIELARDRQIVMVNEEHRSSMQRAFSNRLLGPLRDIGFTHLAVETVSEKPSSLAARGYPSLHTGTYTLDPVFGDLLRRALELGYVVVGYEADAGVNTPQPDDASPADAMNRRETGQAENIVSRILEPHPDARILVIAGRGHIAESAGEWTPMGGLLKGLTGIDPLSIQMTTMAEHSAPEYEHWAFRALDDAGRLGNESVVLRNDAGTLWSANPEAFDVHLFHPRTRTINGRPDWMRMGTLRKRVEVEVPSNNQRVLLQAVFANEGDDAVPADQVVLHPGKPVPALFLRPGSYVIRVIDASGTEIRRIKKSVEK